MGIIASLFTNIPASENNDNWLVYSLKLKPVESMDDQVPYNRSVCGEYYPIQFIFVLADSIDQNLEN